MSAANMRSMSATRPLSSLGKRRMSAISSSPARKSSTSGKSPSARPYLFAQSAKWRLRGDRVFHPTSTRASSNDWHRPRSPCFESSTRALDSSKDRPNRRRRGRASARSRSVGASRAGGRFPRGAAREVVEEPRLRVVPAEEPRHLVPQVVDEVRVDLEPPRAAAEVVDSPEHRVARELAELAEQVRALRGEDRRVAARARVRRRRTEGAEAHARRLGRAEHAPELPEPGQDKSDSTSLQRECSARARSGKSIHASRPFREMIARPKISRNEWKTAEI